MHLFTHLYFVKSILDVEYRLLKFYPIFWFGRPKCPFMFWMFTTFPMSFFSPSFSHLLSPSIPFSLLSCPLLPRNHSAAFSSIRRARASSASERASPADCFITGHRGEELLPPQVAVVDAIAEACNSRRRRLLVCSPPSSTISGTFLKPNRA